MEENLARLAGEVAELKFLVLVAVAVMGVVLLGLLVMLTIAIRTNKMALERSTATMFKDEAQHMLEAEKYEELIATCQQRISSRPGDAWAHYFLANGYFRRGELAKAKEYFLNAKNLEPLFLQHAEQALKEIEVALVNARPRSV